MIKQLCYTYSLVWVGVLVCNEVLGSCYEVIKYILLLVKDSLLMPAVTVLPAGSE